MTRKQFLPGMVVLAAAAAASLPVAFGAASGDVRPCHYKRKRGRKFKGHRRGRR